MSDIQKIIVPDVGGDEVEVIELCVAVGDNIEADEGVVTVESDKASMDIPAPFEGEIVSLSVSVGDKIKEGDVIGEMKVLVVIVAAPLNHHLQMNLLKKMHLSKKKHQKKKASQTQHLLHLAAAKSLKLQFQILALTTK